MYIYTPTSSDVGTTQEWHPRAVCSHFLASFMFAFLSAFETHVRQDWTFSVTHHTGKRCGASLAARHSNAWNAPCTAMVTTIAMLHLARWSQRLNAKICYTEKAE